MVFEVKMAGGALWYLDRIAAHLGLPEYQADRRKAAFNTGMNFSTVIMDRLRGVRNRLGLFQEERKIFVPTSVYPFDVRDDKQAEPRIKGLRKVVENRIPIEYSLEDQHIFALDGRGETALRRDVDYLRRSIEGFGPRDLVRHYIDFALVSSILESNKEVTSTLEGNNVYQFRLKNMLYWS